MSIIIIILCLLVSFVATFVLAGKVFNVSSPGKVVLVGVVTATTLAALALWAFGALAAGAALVGVIAGTIAYSMLVAQLGGC